MAASVVPAALLALKEALGLQEPLWLAGTEPCSETAPWPNLYCNSQGRVYMIDLSSKGLTGKLGEGVDLSKLPNLQALWLFDNPTLTGARVFSVFGGVDGSHQGLCSRHIHAHAIGWAQQCHCCVLRMLALFHLQLPDAVGCAGTQAPCRQHGRATSAFGSCPSTAAPSQGRFRPSGGR